MPLVASGLTPNGLSPPNQIPRPLLCYFLPSSPLRLPGTVGSVGCGASPVIYFGFRCSMAFNYLYSTAPKAATSRGAPKKNKIKSDVYLADDKLG
jgi:hypothetical protein